MYQLRDYWDYLYLLQQWVFDHGPHGKTPLTPDLTSVSFRGNYWEDVIAMGGHQAAVARQAPPAVAVEDSDVVASVGKWDPGVSLDAIWVVNGKPMGESIAVEQGQELSYSPSKACQLQLYVTGTKRGYKTETRKSNVISVGR